MRPLNRPMFKNGGPIKEGIMDGMKEPQAFNTVGNNANRDAMGREKHGFFIPALYGAAMAGIRALPTVYRSMRTASKFSPSQSGGFFRNLFPTGRFMNVRPTISRTKERTVPNASGTYSPIKIDQGKPLGVFQSLRDPTRLGQAIRENPFTAGTIGIGAAGQIKNIPDIVSGGVGLAADTGLGIANYLLGTDFSRDKSDIKTDKVNKDLKRVENLTTEKSVGEVNTKSDELSESEKNKINEDRINETKQKYYKLMGVDKLNKDAVYNTLIDASNKIREGGNIKDQLKSGDLVGNVINSLSKNLDSSVDLKKQIDAAILKGEIEKDINKTKLTSFQEQIKFIKENPNDPLAKKLAGATSVADIVAASAAQGKSSTITSGDIASMIDSKGTNVSGTIPDDQYQKWFKSNKNKDEIDFFIEKYSGADDGLYVVNKKAFIKRGNEIAPISLDSIIG